MERLTKRIGEMVWYNGEYQGKKRSFEPCEVISDCSASDIRKMLWKLAHYEDLEEQGRLVVLPCKVGSTVYKLCPVSPFLKKGDLWSGRIIEHDCDMCAWGSCVCYDIGPHYDDHHKNIVHEMRLKSLETIVRIIPYWGKFYFSTREEAEAALRRTDNG